MEGLRTSRSSKKSSKETSNGPGYKMLKPNKEEVVTVNWPPTESANQGTNHITSHHLKSVTSDAR